jgi:hypothetical protein
VLYQAGKDLVEGLKNGITAAWGRVTGKLKELVGGIGKTAKKLLGIGSPSKVFAEIGRQTAQGLAQGIEDSRALVARAAAGLSGVTIGAGELGFSLAGAAGGGRSVVIERVHVEIGPINVGPGGNPDEVRSAVAAGSDQLLVRLAREIGRL